MFKSFCDCCGEPAPSKNSSFRFENLLGGSTKIGLQVVPLCNGKTGSTHFLCTECAPKLLLAAAETFTSSKVITNHRELLSTSESAIENRRKLIDGAKKSAEKEEAMKTRLLSVQEELKFSQNELKEARKEIKILTAKVNSVLSISDAATRREAAAQLQDEIDRRENPHYVVRVEQRERLRASGK